MDVLFAETAVNYNWVNIMKIIKDDPLDFYKRGGWEFIQPGKVLTFQL